MKFSPGDATDSKQCVALTHEFLRCRDAFEEFSLYAPRALVANENKWLAFKAYNAYSRFIHHLYEFMSGAYTREQGDTDIARWGAEKVALYISGHTQRILTNKREAIKNGTAPAWENALSAYPENIPADFAREFRTCRNTVAGHVTHDRPALSLSDFYDRYHLYLHMLYWEALQWWGNRGEEFPDLQEITNFTIAIKKDVAES